MQAYHQSFNPQAYMANTANNAAAAAAAAAYYHHNPANYVLQSQYGLTEGFGYAANPTTAVAAAAALANPQAYNSQVNAYIHY
jgi:hypothetical protein